jgi:hypothetical protein
MMPGIEWVIDLAWKSAIAAGLTLAVLRVMRGRSAAQRSFSAHAGLLAIAALPLATLLLPVWAPLPAASYPAEASVQPGWGGRAVQVR